jgi:undecaprenyl diphosphate synthase
METSMNQNKEALPSHVGIIMDGNGRWAKKRGLSRSMGHKRGADVFGTIARHARDVGIEALTVYAFSTENWKRPDQEVSSIMNLLREYLSDADRYEKDNMRMRILGEQDRLDDDIRQKIADIESRSASYTGMRLNIALNYGGRGEILTAARRLAELYAAREITDLAAVSEADFGNLLYTAGLPDVDLVIRTSGEYRISNFLLWQSAYAEYVFSDVLWPDFSTKDFDAALAEYANRGRRLGGV